MENCTDAKKLRKNDRAMVVKIKNMVCDRCITAVKQVFQKAGVIVERVQLGEVETCNEIDDSILNVIDENLKINGFEIINDSKSRLIDLIKATVTDYIYQNLWDEKRNFSEFLVDKVNLDYSYLSSLFSPVEGITIEQYLIHLKIERVKELMVYDQKSLSEIAWEMGYSSVAHLSGQFKKVTGYSPSYFKMLKEQKLSSLNDGLDSLK